MDFYFSGKNWITDIVPLGKRYFFYDALNLELSKGVGSIDKITKETSIHESVKLRHNEVHRWIGRTMMKFREDILVYKYKSNVISFLMHTKDQGCLENMIEMKNVKKAQKIDFFNFFRFSLKISKLI